MKKILFLGLLGSFTFHAYSQGCIPVRSTGSSVFEKPASGRKTPQADWTFSATNRYFESYRHFSGDVEQKERVAAGTEVINKSYTLDLNATHFFNRRWSASVNLPLVSNNRSSLYEHGGQARHSTQSFGLGDLRLTAYRWMLDPKYSKKANFQTGLGIKLPTGNYKADDLFQSAAGVPVRGPVDQSIQLGDGGTALTGEVNAFVNTGRKSSIYTSLFYLLNPRETNGVSTARGRTPSAASVAYGSDVMSVPDQYMARLGATWAVKKFNFSAGMRIDGIPAEDLVGGSDGFRRPGYIISAEPGITYRNKRFTSFLNVPVAIERNRIQSVPDKIRSEITKAKFTGDAAFADFVVNLGMAFTLNKKSKTVKPSQPKYYERIYHRYPGCRPYKSSGSPSKEVIKI